MADLLSQEFYQSLLGMIQIGVIQGLIHLAAKFELFFVNSMSMPFNTGIAVYLILLNSRNLSGVYYSRHDRAGRASKHTVFSSYDPYWLQLVCNYRSSF